MIDERDHSKFIIQRLDTHIGGANTKGNFLLAINTFLIGVIIANYNKILELIVCKYFYVYFNIGVVLLILLCLIATFYILKAVYPFLLSGNSSKDDYHSHIFFNSIAEFEDSDDFKKSFKNQTDENVEEDMAKQAYILAKGLKSKYHFLEVAMKFIYAQLVILIILLTLIILF